LTERLRVLEVPGVAYLVGPAKGPIPLGEEEVANIRGLSRPELSAEPHPYLPLGRRVRIRSGALQGFEGVLVRKKDNFRLVISVDSIMRSVSLEVDVAEVDATPLAAAA